MRLAEAAPRYGALLMVAVALLVIVALVCSPVILALLVIAGAGR